MEILIPLTLFVVVGAIFIVPRYFKSREREQVQQTVRAAIERGQPLPPEVIEAITRDIKPAHVVAPGRDLRRAVIWIAVALALIFMGYLASWEDGDGWYVGLGFAAIPGFVGLAYLAMGIIELATQRKVKA